MGERMQDSVFFIPFLLVILIELISSGFVFFLPIHLSAIGLSGWQIGFLFAITTIAGLFLQFFVGVLTDRAPIRWVAVAGFVFLAAHLAGFSIAMTFLSMSLIFIFRGLAHTFLSISLESFTLKKAENSERIGIYVLLQHLALGIGMILSGILIFSLDFPLAMQIAAGVAVLAGFLAIRISNVPGTMEGLDVYFKDFMKPRILFFAILIFLFGSHWGVEQTSYGLFLQENLRLTTQAMGIFMGVPVMFLGLGGLFFGRMRDRGMTFKQLLIVAFLVSGGAFAAMAITTDVQISFLFRIIHEIGDGAWGIFMLAGAHVLFRTERMGGSYGLVAFSGLLGAAAGTLIYGPMGDAFGYHVPHIVSGALIVASAGLFPFLKIDEKPAQSHPTASLHLAHQEITQSPLAEE